MTKKIKVTVVIPVKNPGQLFRKVLESVLSQITKWRYEVIIIDSGSTDGTIEYCKSHKAVNLIQIPPEEFGHGKTRNLGAEKAKGEFVAFITHDALPANEFWLQNIVSAMEKDKEIAGAFGRHLPYDNASPFLKKDLNAIFDNLKKNDPVSFIKDREKYDEDVNLRRMFHFYSDNNSCLRKSVWKKYPYPDVEYAEDQLWAKTIIEAGYKKVYVDNSAVYHSHNFGIIQSFRRSFDESIAYRKLFGYKVIPTFKRLILVTGAQSLRDLKYLSKVKISMKDIYWVLTFPFVNFMRYLGYYLGAYYQKLPGWVINYVSIDKRLKDKK